MPRTFVRALPDHLAAHRSAPSAWLRAETLSDHRAAESTVDVAAVRTTPALAALLLGWHEVWCAARTAALADGASAVAREELVVASGSVVSALGIDLASIDRPVLGLSVVRDPRDGLADLLAEPASAWGVAYVLLGSRLGNAAIAQQIRWAVELPDTSCTRFLAPQVAHLGRDWNAFRGRLDAAAFDDDAREQAVAAARWTFAWVGAVLGAQLATATARAAA